MECNKKIYSTSKSTGCELRKWTSIEDMISTCPKNDVIGNNLVIAWSKINNSKYKKIMCSISGGSDSDIMLDIVWKCDVDNKVNYVWFDTGLEYQATKDHLKYLESKYGIEIIKYKAIKPIPKSCREYGQPFISKYVSEMISRLQKHNFDWSNESFDILYEKYPKCKAALNWWCNNSGEKSRFNIERNRWLKEFMIENPPSFKISSKCCKYAKKDVAHKCLKELEFDLNIQGVRRDEQGVRSTTYKNCFTENNSGIDDYRPLFWYKNVDKNDYEDVYFIEHSKCYSEYGLKRTGCSGCPFGRDFEFELEVINKYEPRLYKAVNNIFGDSYEYTRKYREFAKRMRMG